MALAETASLIVKLDLQGNFGQQLGKANRALGTFDARLDRSQSRAFRAGQQIGTGIKNAAKIAAVGIGFLALNVEQGLDSLVKLEQQTTQTNAAIKSTKGIAGITASEVRRLAESFESMNAIIGDEVIQNTENLLLSFTNIRKRAFRPTLQAILDMNTRLGGGPNGLAGIARIVGRALNDPVKGLAALTRKGVVFNATQTKRIKALAKEGKLYEAQAVILGELNRRFGGAFAAEGTTTGAKVAKFKDAIEDLQRTLAAGLLPVVSNVADALAKLLSDPAVQRDVAKFGQDLGKFFSKENIGQAFKTLGDVISTIRGALPTIVSGAQAIGAVVSKAVELFNSLPTPLKQLLVGGFAVNKLTGGLITNIGGGIFDRLFARGSSPANPMWVAMAGGPGGLPTGAPPGGPGGGPVTPAIGAGIFLPGGYIEKKWDEFRTHLVPPDRGLDSPALHNMPPNTDRQLDSPALRSAANSLKTIAVNSRILTHPSMAPTLHPPEVDRGAMEKNRWRDLAKVFGDAAFKANIEDRRAMTAAVQDSPLGKQTVAGIDRVDTSVTTGLSAVKDTTSTSAVTTQGVVRTASDSNASRIVGATQSQTGAIVSAIWAARPIINVTNITRTTTIQQRYGPSNGSYGTDSGANPGK